jgi:glyoxylase-like metal-dependent hydrolase (beta-lactamase superfamily II)
MVIKEIIVINDNIIQYVFKNSDTNPHIDLNITVILNGDRAVLIDVGYPRHARLVREDLSLKGISVEKIIISHYHPDHAAGAVEFPDIPLACSKNYKDNFYLCSEVWSTTYKYKEPDELISHMQTYMFRNNRFKFIEAPGHSKCSLITVINDNIAHVGDLILYSAYDKQALPFICNDGSFTGHIKSLELLKDSGFDVLLLAHGKPLVGESIIKEEIDKRIYYLKKMIETNGRGTLDDCALGGANNWAFSKWHITNCRNFRLIRD